MDRLFGLGLKLGAAAVLVVLAVAVSAQATFPGVPASAERILERDWCSPASYTKARNAAPRLDANARRNLSESERTARRYPRGCQIGERGAHGRSDQFPQHPAWTKRGPHGDDCPLHPLPVGTNWRHAASLAAAAVDARSERPIVVGRGGPRHQTRRGQIRYACGSAAVRRSVVVGLALTRAYPAASASTQIVALSRFRGLGWRVWMLLH
ncbi:MAG TPA: hypothetical protein VH817_08590 [Thermoleophilaceae bacterium]|jgi:hypothetical protein